MLFALFASLDQLGQTAAIAVAICGALGGLLGGVAAFWGVSRRVKVEDSDAASRRRSRVFEAFHNGMLVTDRDLTIIDANKQARAITGYLDLVGRSVYELIPERLRDVHRDHVARYFDDPHTRRMGTSGMHLSLVDRFGREKPMRLSLTPMENEYGGIEVTVGMEVIQ